MSAKLIRSVVEYILMVGIPIVIIVLILHAGNSHKVPPPFGKVWKLQASRSTTPNQTQPHNAAQCYGLKLPATLYMEQSGRFLHTTIGHASASGKIHENTWQLDFKPTSGPCAGEDTRLSGDIQDKNPRWPAVMNSETCTQCAPLHLEIYRKKG